MVLLGPLGFLLAPRDDASAASALAQSVSNCHNPGGVNERREVALAKETEHIHQAEARHWDQVARESEEELLMTAEVQVVNDPYFGRALEYLGDLTGKRVLDCACGTGHWTVMLALRGAEVVGFDVSPECVRTTQERARVNGVEDRVRAIEAPFEGLPDDLGQFDFAFGAFALHHVDLASAGPALARLLKPGGRAVFVETSARNPILMLARRNITYRLGLGRVGSEDEHPLTRKDVESLGSLFRAWRCDYPAVFCFQLFSRILYQTIIARTVRGPAPIRALGSITWTVFSALFRALDAPLHWIRPLRPLSYWFLVELEN